MSDDTALSHIRSRSRCADHYPEESRALLLSSPIKPRRIPSADHIIKRTGISANALKVLDRLHEAGFESYLVGGGVRDLLLAKRPKDFDVSTNASPDEIKQLFKNCRLIGRRFRLAHIVFGREVIEVATFRAAHSEGEGGVTGDSGRIVRDNVYGGTVGDDAARRDFTVNALYYDVSDGSVLDYFDGIEDLNRATLRFIGDARIRVVEDPVRALRAARFAAKLGFSVAGDAVSAIEENKALLKGVPAARLFDEVLKLLQTGHGLASLQQLRQLELFEYLFPSAAATVEQGDEKALEMFTLALENTDRRIQNELAVTPAFIYAVFLWPEVSAIADKLTDQGEPPVQALHLAADEVVPAQLACTSLPRRFSVPMRDIWAMQPRFRHTRGKRVKVLIASRRFRAAYDFLCLRAQIGEVPQKLCDTWEQLQQTPEAQAAIAASRQRPAPDKHSRNRGRRRAS